MAITYPLRRRGQGARFGDLFSVWRECEYVIEVHDTHDLMHSVNKACWREHSTRAAPHMHVYCTNHVYLLVIDIPVSGTSH
jgi:hypothetical protein